MPVSSLPSSSGKTTAVIRDNREVISPALPHARVAANTKTHPVRQNNAMEFMQGATTSLENLSSVQPKTASTGKEQTIANRNAVGIHGRTVSMSRSLVSARALVSEIKSVATSSRAAVFHEVKIRAAPTPPSARASIDPPLSNRITANNQKVGIVLKGVLFAATEIPAPRQVPVISDPKALDGYLSKLQTRIASSKQYPESARKSGREGEVTIQFTVLKSGAVKNIQLVRKTNYPELNEEAIQDMYMRQSLNKKGNLHFI